MPKFGHRIGSAGMVLAALVALGSGPVQAAPQALALVSTYGKVGMTCEGGECSAELSSFCLDSSRFSPSRGTPYQLVGNGQVRLNGITDDGSVLSLDTRSYLGFESARRHLAVKASVPHAALTALGISRVEIEIGENVALLPVPVPGDPDRITESEAAVLSRTTAPARRPDRGWQQRTHAGRTGDLAHHQPAARPQRSRCCGRDRLAACDIRKQ